MSDFINTIDKYGDRGTLKRIIEGTLDEFCDDAITNLHSYSLTQLPNLKRIEAPNVTSVGSVIIEGSGNIEYINLKNLPYNGGSSGIVYDVARAGMHIKNWVLDNYFANSSCVMDKDKTTVLYYNGIDAVGDVVLPDTVTKINGNALRDNTSVTSISGKNVKTIEDYAFFNQTGFLNITSVDLPNLETLKGTGFQRVKVVGELNLPKLKNAAYINGDYITSLNLASYETTSYAGGNNPIPLYSTTIPATFPIQTLILKKWNSPSGNIFWISASTPNWNTLVLADTKSVGTLDSYYTYNPFAYSGNLNCYVPHNLVDEYKNATNWSTYASRIFPIGGEVTITNNNNMVAISCDGTGGELKYQINGGEPVVYTSPFSINEGDIVRAYYERFHVIDGEAFLNFDVQKVGGRIGYIDNSVTGVNYTFYREDTTEITGWTSAEDLKDAYYYKKQGSSDSDKVYVLYTNVENSGRVWTIYANSSYQYDALGLTDKTTFCGKANTQYVLNYNNGAYTTNTTNIWTVLNNINSSDELSDWYVPSYLECKTFVGEYCKELGFSCWTSTEREGDRAIYDAYYCSSGGSLSTNGKNNGNYRLIPIRSF